MERVSKKLIEVHVPLTQEKYLYAKEIAEILDDSRNYELKVINQKMIFGN